MGQHRAARRAPRRPSKTSTTPYIGRRAATPTSDLATAQTIVAEAQRISAPPVAPQVHVDLVHHFGDVEATSEFPLISAATPASAGRRKAVRQANTRGPIVRFLPTAPVAAGLATIAVAMGGAVATTSPQLASAVGPRLQQASALTGEGGVSSANAFTEVRRAPVSRDSRRDALASVADTTLVAAAEKQARQRDVALGQLAKQAEQQATKIAKNQWVYPLGSVILTAKFGQYGLWSSYHTGLDFNGNSGDEIKSMTNGVITSTGYDGAYGNKTVVTMDDGTEIWYCHQTSYYVSAGQTVRAGEVIGTVGTTGNVTGSHLHVEVRPGGGDPVDPYAAMRNNGLF